MCWCSSFDAYFEAYELYFVGFEGVRGQIHVHVKYLMDI